MPVNYRSRNQLLLAKVEAQLGVEEAPTPAANAVRVRLPLAYQTQPNVLETNYAQGGIDESAPLVGPGLSSLTCGGILGGSGTAGTAPDIAPLLRACGFAETVTAAPVTGTADAGAAGSITLDNTESVTPDAYKGMVIRITGGTGAGQRRIITGYTASRVATVFPAWTVTPDATSVYAIDANVRYRLASTGIPGLTLWAYMLNSGGGGDALRRRLIGARGTMQFTLAPRGYPEISFEFRGRSPAPPDSVAEPAAATFQAEASAPFVSAECFVGNAGVTSEANARLQISAATINLANELENFDDPATADGYDVTEIVRRIPQGTLTPNILKTPRDLFADMVNNADRTLWLNWGQVAGKRVSILVPAARFTQNTEADVRGYAAEEASFRSHGTDDSLWICFW